MLQDFQQVQASVLQVARTPGKWVVYVGSTLLVLGVLAMLYVRERRLWSQGDAADWAMESFRLTETWVYPQVADDVIDEVEIESNRPVVETQLRKAGWRLAWVLNAALDPGASGPAP